MFVAGDAADSMIVIVDGEAEAKCKNGKVVPWTNGSLRFFFPECITNSKKLQNVTEIHLNLSPRGSINFNDLGCTADDGCSRGLSGNMW